MSAIICPFYQLIFWYFDISWSNDASTFPPNGQQLCTMCSLSITIYVECKSPPVQLNPMMIIQATALRHMLFVWVASLTFDQLIRIRWLNDFLKLWSYEPMMGISPQAWGNRFINFWYFDPGVRWSDDGEFRDRFSLRALCQLLPQLFSTCTWRRSKLATQIQSLNVKILLDI